MRLWILFSFLMILSCGKDNRSKGKKKMIGTSFLREGVVADLNVAQNICYAFKAKNIRFRIKVLGEKFNFKVSIKNCEGDSSTSIIKTVLTEIGDLFPMKYALDQREARDIAYYDTVQTHKHGFLHSFCDKILRGDTAFNTEFDEKREETVQYILYDKDVADFDGISLVYFKDEDSPSYKEVRLYIDLEKSFTNQYGLVYRLELFETCLDGPFQKSLIQEHIP